MDLSSSPVPTWLQELPKEFLWLVTYACLFPFMHTCLAIQLMIQPYLKRCEYVLRRAIET